MLHSLVGDGLDEDWDAIVRVNILGMLHITSAALPHLRAATLADLVVIASLASDRVAAPDYSVYAATKAAQLRLTDGLRLELAEDRGSAISLVKPGFMNTPGIGTGTRRPGAPEAGPRAEGADRPSARRSSPRRSVTSWRCRPR